jgi:hypothetical protein
VAHDSAGGGGGTLGEDGGGEKAATITHQGELVATFGQVHEAHLALLSGRRLGVAGPHRPGFAEIEDEGTGPLEDVIGAAQARGDEAGPGEVNVEGADADAKLAVNLADDVRNVVLQSIGAVPRRFGRSRRPLFPCRRQARPPAGEGGEGSSVASEKARALRRWCRRCGSSKATM